MNLLSIVLFGIGTILVYSGVKGYDPRAVVQDAIQGKSNPGEGSELGSTVIGQKFGTYDPNAIPKKGKPPKHQKGGVIEPLPNSGVNPPDGVSGPDVVGV